MKANSLVYVVVFGSLLLGFIIGAMAVERLYRNDAIEAGCAQFNSKTAQFEWIDKGNASER